MGAHVVCVYVVGVSSEKGAGECFVLCEEDLAAWGLVSCGEWKSSQ